MWLIECGNTLLSRWDLVLPLLVAHLLIDFSWQPTRWVEAKQDRRFLAWQLYVHGLGAGLLAWLCIWRFEAWWIVPLIAGTHVVSDGLKYRLRSELRAFLVDQSVHLLVLVVVVLLLHTANPVEVRVEPARGWVLLFSFLLVWSASGTFIGIATSQWRDALQDAGLANAGLWIGRLERLLILIFVLASTLEAVGWLVAAKSILRFSTRSREGGSDTGQKRTEYVLIGTMASFTIALLTGLLARYLLG